MMVSPWSDSGGSLPPPGMKLWFLQAGPAAGEPLTDMAAEQRRAAVAAVAVSCCRLCR